MYDLFRESSTVMLRHPGRTSPKSLRPRASSRPAISHGSSRLGRAFHPPTGARRRAERAPFRNSDRPLTASNFCLNNNFFLPKQQNPRPRFSSFVFSVNFVLELFGPKPCFPSSKIPCCTFALRKRKGDVRPDPNLPPQKIITDASASTPPCPNPLDPGRGVLSLQQPEQIF